MNGLYLASSMAAVVYLLLAVYRLKLRVASAALALMLALHGSNILWVLVTHKMCDGWDGVFNGAFAALTCAMAFGFKKQQRA